MWLHSWIAELLKPSIFGDRINVEWQGKPKRFPFENGLPIFRYFSKTPPNVV